jgi:hypothetical protein
MKFSKLPMVYFFLHFHYVISVYLFLRVYDIQQVEDELIKKIGIDIIEKGWIQVHKNDYFLTSDIMEQLC